MPGDSHVLDEIDLAIVRELAQDGRRSVSRIAAAVGARRAVVSARIDRMIASRALDIVPIPLRRGYGPGTTAFVSIRTEPARSEDVAAALGTIPEVWWGATTSGRFDVIAEVHLNDIRTLFTLLRRRLGILPGVLEVNVQLVLRQTTTRMSWLPGSENGIAWSDEAAGADTVDSDTVDSQIIDLLTPDGRRSASEIAKELGLSVSTVTGRIERLATRGISKVVGVLDPTRIGYTSHALIGIRALPSAIEAVGDALVTLPDVFWVWHLSGSFDVLADVWLPRGATVTDYLADHVRDIPGLTTVEAFEIRSPSAYLKSKGRSANIQANSS